MKDRVCIYPPHLLLPALCPPPRAPVHINLHFYICMSYLFVVFFLFFIEHYRTDYLDYLEYRAAARG